MAEFYNLDEIQKELDKSFSEFTATEAAAHAQIAMAMMQFNRMLSEQWDAEQAHENLINAFPPEPTTSKEVERRR